MRRAPDPYARQADPVRRRREGSSLKSARNICRQARLPLLVREPSDTRVDILRATGPDDAGTQHAAAVERCLRLRLARLAGEDAAVEHGQAEFKRSQPPAPP